MSAHFTFDIQGMHCASCVARIESAIKDVPGVLTVEANLSNDSLRVSGHDLSAPLLQGRAAEIGFALSPKETAQSKTAKIEQETSRLKRAVLIAAALTIPVVVLAMGGHMFPAFGEAVGHRTNTWLQFVLTTLVMCWPGARFYRLGIPALLRRHPDMNALVALGTLAAWGYSTLVLLAPSLLPQNARDVYFEAAAVIVTLILVGRLLELRAKGQTGHAVAKLIALQPDTVVQITGDTTNEVQISEIATGDHLLVRPGARVPLDGVVIGGESYVDESMITGEPVPVLKSEGDQITGGTVNTNGALTCRVVAIGKDTTLARIIALVEQAQGTRLPIQSLVNQITGYFVPAVLVIALITVCLWLAFGPGLSYAMVAGVSVLIIACPCALGLATPTSIMVGTGRAAELGVLFAKGDALQSLQDVDMIAFDKTGTLTHGRPELTECHVVDGTQKNSVLSLAASAEQNSEHPIARAIVDHAIGQNLPLHKVETFSSQTGLGVQAVVAGQSVDIGSAKFMKQIGAATAPLDALAQEAEQKGSTAIYVALDGRLAAFFCVADPIKPNAKPVIHDLQQKGIKVVMISGDTQTTAAAVAVELGIKTVIAGVLPEGKAEALTQLDARKLAFVGDGINDAPALAAADVGIALGTGTDIAIETADVVLMNGDISGVARAVELSHATLRNIRQNLVWAFGYNLLLIPVAAGALYPATGMLLSPALAAAAMALSSVFVVSNALRLRNHVRVAS